MARFGGEATRNADMLPQARFSILGDIAIQLEERDLVRFHGETYQRYRRQVSMILPMPGRTAEPDKAAAQKGGAR